MKKNKAFSYSTTYSAEKSTVKLVGIIGGEFNIFLSDFQGTHSLHLDMSGVMSINSAGTRLLTLWFRDVERTYPKMHVTLDLLPPIMARQIAALRNFLPLSFQIGSVYVPMFCDACDLEDHSLVITKAEIGGQADFERFLPPSKSCPKCTRKMEFDFEPDRYFRILWPRDRW